ncbi:serine/threonine-protein kinase [Actinacidiphila sp. bgisy167]|uniref:serine/threonine-protein kinase n=1 Tax=Actinacidiphila sp. bgisy167 TaxID=3413797 RepID=UPI003D7338A8
MTRLVAGRYRLISELGRGGMGVVWLARDELLHREVAIKEVKAPAGLEDSEIERLYARLQQEGIAAARVEHPNVIKVYDVAMAEGSPWIVMELVRGVALADVLDAEGPVDPRRAAGIGGKVLRALRAGHAAGVLHRDVKPGNVLIGNDGRVVLTDFGIAVIEGTSAITRTGELVGSPEYLAPERALGRRPGPESDLWSLGVLLYVAVEGGSPFRPRRTAVAVGVLVLALGLGGLAYALFDDEPVGRPGRGTSAGDTPGGGRSPSAADTQEDDGGDADAAGHETTAGSGSPPSPPTSAPPTTPVPVNVHVTVSAVRDSYIGSCPPPPEQAPSFSAVVTVDRTPATVTYRWTSNAGGSGEDRRTLGFAEGGPKSRTIHSTEAAYEPDGTVEGWVAVAVLSPVKTESGHVPFTVTCRAPSPSPSGSTETAPTSEADALEPTEQPTP